MPIFGYEIIEMKLINMEAKPLAWFIGKKIIKSLLAFSVSTLVITSHAFARVDNFQPLVVFQGKLQPGSYLQLIEQGIQRFELNTGVSVKRIHLAPDNSQYISELEQAAQQGYSPILIQESSALSSFQDVTQRNPSTRFISLGIAYHVPNVLGLVFGHAEGAYAIGYLAGRKTQTNKVGFIGGMNIDVINQFQCGYELGVQDANSNATVYTKYINSGEASWEDTQRAKQLTQSLLADQVDVIFPVAGLASFGVVDTIRDNDFGYSFGIDYDYSSRYPETTLASLEKKVDLAVYAALMQLKNGIWNGNRKTLGVKQGVISISLNHNNPALNEQDKQAVKTILLDLQGKNSVISQRINQHCSG